MSEFPQETTSNTHENILTRDMLVEFTPEQREEILYMLEKTESQISSCIRILSEHGSINEVRHPKEEPLPLDEEHRQQFIDHTCFMAHEAYRMLIDLKTKETITLSNISRWGKINRWLGCVQMNLISLGWITIGNARDTNR